jgi:hypothetical protein
MEMILIYPVFIGISVVTAQYAREKGYSGKWWFIWGSLLPVFSILILFTLKRKEPRVDPPVKSEESSRVLYQRYPANDEKNHV